MNKLYKSIINFLVIVPFPNSVFGWTSNALTLAYISVLLPIMLFLMSPRFWQMKMKLGMIIIYLLIFSILIFNITSLFAITFYLKVTFAITAGWFLFIWNSSSSENEFVGFLRSTLYAIGVLSFLVFFIAPPEDGRLISLFDVHTSKYFFFAFVIIFTHQVLRYNRTSDYLALGFAFLLLSLSLQRGILATAIFFLLLAFREKVLRKLTWMALLLIVFFQLGLFDPLIKKLFYAVPTSGNLRDIISNINTSGRLEFWVYLWENVKISFLGNGLGFSIDIGKTFFPGLNLVHNDFLWLLMDVGIFGIAVLTITILYMYRSVSKQNDSTLKRVYHSLLLSIPLVMFVDNFVFHVYIYFPILFGYYKFYCNR
ncbi:MAG TPA: O-antigen ligase family protein [Cyclobacteriaceae bacterium]|nr:O-antigen ligase family protein [Cyclobacteriaceae bacterium]